MLGRLLGTRLHARLPPRALARRAVQDIGCDSCVFDRSAAILEGLTYKTCKVLCASTISLPAAPAWTVPSFVASAVDALLGRRQRALEANILECCDPLASRYRPAARLSSVR